jgi:hypothetical protein
MAETLLGRFMRGKHGRDVAIEGNEPKPDRSVVKLKRGDSVLFKNNR